jgi:thiol-disulfide isomerase/thioredoxin
MHRQAVSLNDKWRLLLVGLLLGLGMGAAVLIGFAWHNRADSRQEGISGLEQPSETAPDFSLQGLDGQTVRMSDLHGKFVVLNFWASWCSPCVQEMPMFQQYSERYPSEIAVVGINLQESLDIVQAFTTKIGVSYPIVLDKDGTVSELFHVVGLPDTFFIDQEGVIRQRHIGSLSRDQLDAYLVQLGAGK